MKTRNCLWCEYDMDSPNGEEYCCAECKAKGNGDDGYE